MIAKQERFRELEADNQDEYGKPCVDVARRAMELLDDRPGDIQAIKLVLDAMREIDESLSGFQTGVVASVISECDSRGEEFKTAWNKEESGDPTEDGVNNPALMTIDTT